MNWHTRYTQQAEWTRDLRTYIFDKIKLNKTHRVLEVGCGTGAILSEIPGSIPCYGLDINPVMLAQCRVHASAALLACGDVLQLPYTDNSFDVVYCHFLLLWVNNPLHALLEMKRITKTGGHIIAFAEPDYTQRVDQPDELKQLGKWQNASLKEQGADPGFGARLAESFFQAGIKIIETGTIQSVENEASLDEWEMEWAVIESDLVGSVNSEDIQKMKRIDKTAREQNERILHIPTYFAWGSIEQ
jgi:ubiquinone/menaquinone biosynthesis C-methylase UbiE